MASSGKLIWGPTSTFSYNNIPFSANVASLSGEDSADEVEVTGFGETYREYIVGLKDATVTATMFQDFGGTSVDEVIGAAYRNQTTGTVKINPDTNGTVVYTMLAKIYSYSPFNGGVGDAQQFDVTLRNAGTAGVTRGTA